MLGGVDEVATGESVAASGVPYQGFPHLEREDGDSVWALAVPAVETQWFKL